MQNPATNGVPPRIGTPKIAARSARRKTRTRLQRALVAYKQLDGREREYFDAIAEQMRRAA